MAIDCRFACMEGQKIVLDKNTDDSSLTLSEKDKKSVHGEGHWGTITLQKCML